MLGGDDGGGPSAGRRKAGTSAGGRGVPVRRKLSEAGGEKDHGVCGAGAGRQERQRHFAEHEKSAHASDIACVCGFFVLGKMSLPLLPSRPSATYAVIFFSASFRKFSSDRYPASASTRSGFSPPCAWAASVISTKHPLSAAF